MGNIFIEGIQGLGKSTLLQAILEKKPELRVCREGDYSPVELAWCAWMTEEEYHRALSRYSFIQKEIQGNTVREGSHYIVAYTKIITDIPGFHKDLEQYEILILFHGLGDDEIIAFYQKLYAVMPKEGLRLIYLYSDALEESTGIIRKERSDNQGNELWYPMMLEYLVSSPYGKQHGYQGFEDMVAHFRHRQQVELRIIDEVLHGHAVILPAKQWKLEDIMEQLR